MVVWALVVWALVVWALVVFVGTGGLGSGGLGTSVVRPGTGGDEARGVERFCRNGQLLQRLPFFLHKARRRCALHNVIENKNRRGKKSSDVECCNIAETETGLQKKNKKVIFVFVGLFPAW